MYTFVCCLNPGVCYVQVRDSDLASLARLGYKDPAAGTSACEGTIAERGWKFVFPTNQ